MGIWPRPMRLLSWIGFSLLILHSNGYRSRRLRRQIIPSQHIQVHSLDSNVMLNDHITVESTDNRIDINERCVNGSLWSDHSLLLFDTYDTFVNCSADHVESFLNIQNCAMLHSQGQSADFFMRSNRTVNGHSELTHNLYGSANFSVEDNGLQVQAVDGKRVGIEAQSWDRQVDKRMTLTAKNIDNGERELTLEAFAPLYHIKVCFVGSMMFIQFAEKWIKIEPTYKIIEIFTDKYTVTVKTNESPYKVDISNDVVLISLPNEKARVSVNLGGVTVQSDQLTKTQIDRNGGQMTIGGHPTEADTVKMTSLKTDLDLSNSGHVNSDTMHSNMVMQSSVQQVGMTAGHHNLKIDGGVPHIVVDAGRSCVEITANHGMPILMGIMPPFSPPADKFLNIGPFQGDMLASMNDMSVAQMAIAPNEDMSLTPIAQMPDVLRPPIVEAQISPMLPPLILDVPPMPPTFSEGPPNNLGGKSSLFTSLSLPPGLAADLPQPPTLSSSSNESSMSTSLNDSLHSILSSNSKMKVATVPLDLRNLAADLLKAHNKNTTTLIDEETKNEFNETTIDKIISKNAMDMTKIEATSSTSLPTTTSEETTIITTTTASTTTTTTASTPPPTTETTTTPTTTTLTTTTRTATTTTTSIPTTIDPLAELRKLREEMKKMKTMREWDETEVSHDKDGDEHLETFTFPNGTTVQRLIKTRRRITTTVIHHRKEEVDDNNGTHTVSVAKVVSPLKINRLPSSSNSSKPAKRPNMHGNLVTQPDDEMEKKNSTTHSESEATHTFHSPSILHDPPSMKINNQ